MRLGVQLTGRVIYLVLGVVAALIVLQRLDALFGGSHDAEITAASQARVQIHEALVRYRARLQVAERRNQSLADSSGRLADSLRAALARGERVDTVKILREIATADSTANRRCAVAEPYRQRGVAPGLEKRRQVVQARRHIGMLGTERFLPDGQRAPEERLRCRVIALGLLQRRQVV